MLREQVQGNTREQSQKSIPRVAISGKPPQESSSQTARQPTATIQVTFSDYPAVYFSLHYLFDFFLIKFVDCMFN
jgi:hypothetical protein